MITTTPPRARVAGLTLTATETRLQPLEDGAAQYDRELAARGADVVDLRTVDLQTDIIRRARRAWLAFRRSHGYAGSAPLLTPPSAQPKLGKSATPTYGLMLRPETSVGLQGVNLCPAATRGCAAACLNTAGKGKLDSVQRARHVRTLWILSDPELAGALLIWEQLRAVLRHGQPIRVRLNVTSDLRYELFAPGVMAVARAYAPLMAGTGDAPRPGISHYDYSAWHPAKRRGGNGYRLTFSRKESGALSRPDTLREILRAGSNVAVVFDTPRGAALPATYLGARVIDGDLSDDRVSDPHGVIVGLRAKGDARGESSGFVVATADLTD